MEKVYADAVITHALRDKAQGREWRCQCPLCQTARNDSELVNQIQNALNKVSGPAKKATKETTV